MRVTPRTTSDRTGAPYGPRRPRTASLLTLGGSPCHHTVRSVAQQAYRRLWADAPDRAERWRRVGNMDEVLGIGRPLRTISKEVFASAIEEMTAMAMPWAVIEQHLEDFGDLMTWAVKHGFAEWANSAREASAD